MALLVFILPLAAGAAQTASIGGTVIDQNSGLPVAGAAVEIDGPSASVKTTTDASGGFSSDGLQPGAYTVLFNARGYDVARSESLFVTEGGSATVRVALLRSAQSGGSLREIATVRATRASLQTSSVITERISTERVISQGYVNVGQGLLSLPGITANDLDSAAGDDLHLQVRGQKASETAALLDGHPIGPFGVQNGFRSGFNYQLSPAWGLSDTEVLYGSGGQAVYGVDTIGGAVNFRTLDAGGKNGATFYQSLGTQGRASSILGAHGNVGGWDYGFSYGVQGFTGPFNGQTIPQTALLAQNTTVCANSGPNPTCAGDVSPGNLAANTWRVTGDYTQRSGVLKLRHQLSPQTNITFTAFNAQSFDDKTGEGDNDFWTPEYAGFSWDQLSGTFASCPTGVPIQVDDAGTLQCFNRSQYVSAFAGPSGGTAVAWQTQRLQDYSARLAATNHNNQIGVTLFVDTYNLIYNRNDSGHTNNFQTYGLQISDDIVTNHNDLGFGVYNYAQSELDNQFTAGGPGTGVVYFPTVNSSFNKFFVKDTWTPTTKFSAFFTGWLNSDTITNHTAFEPRLTAVYRPTNSDVVRFSAGRAQGVPGASIVYGAVQYNNAPGNITTANCAANGLTSVATGSNPTLQAEKATDFELALGHRFRDDSQIQVTGYSVFSQNVIFGDLIALQTFGLTPPASLLSQYIAKISGICGHPVTIANLAETTADNAGTGRTRGLTINGRQRFSRHFLADYGWNVLDARLYDIPDRSLKGNGTLVPGLQIDKVPVHTGNLGLEYQSNHGFSLRLDGFYVGNNNALVHPAYAYANGSISQTVKNLTFTLGGFNIFNSHYQQYGLIGYGTFQPENKFNSDATVLQEAFNGVDGEQFGLPHSSFVFSISEKI